MSWRNCLAMLIHGMILQSTDDQKSRCSSLKVSQDFLAESTWHHASDSICFLCIRGTPTKKTLDKDLYICCLLPKKKIFHQMGLDIYIYTQFHSLAEKGILRVNFAAMSQSFLFGIRNCRRYTYIYIYLSIYLSMHAMQCRRVCQFLPVTVGFLGSSLCHMDGLCNGRSQCCLIMCLAVNPHKIRPVEIEWCL